MGKRKKGKVGKPYIRQKKHTQAAPLQKGLLPNWLSTLTNPKCAGDINQDHGLNIKTALSHSHVSSITTLLGPSIYWRAQEKTTNRPQLSSKQSDYQAKGQSHC